MAEAEIVKNISYVTIKGNKKAPGSYNVSKGSKIGYKVYVVNTGSRGGCLLRLYDKNTGNVIDHKSGTLSQGEQITMLGSFSIGKNRALEFRSYHWTTHGWVKDDSWG